MHCMKLHVIETRVPCYACMILYSSCCTRGQRQCLVFKVTRLCSGGWKLECRKVVLLRETDEFTWSLVDSQRSKRGSESLAEGRLGSTASLDRKYNGTIEIDHR